ncbi:MAG: AI-2E family transporter [Spirochaetia bacterium]|nr:AI-2E family transporter [Spirochaetia bacterium]
MPIKKSPSLPRKVAPVEIASWILMGLALLVIIRFHLLPALIAGLLVYQLVHVMAPFLQRRFFTTGSRLVAVIILLTLVLALLTGATIGIVAFFKSDAGNLTKLFKKMADIIDGTRATMPEWVLDYLPTSPEELRKITGGWLRKHAPELQLAGREATRILAHVVVGMIIGSIISVREVTAPHNLKPLANAFFERIGRLGDSFRQIVFAQVTISSINTVFTALYLIVALPLFGVKLPLAKTLIAVTFLTGLLPVLGNLISNTVIVTVSLSHSPQIAIISLGYLVGIHKLEYFLNAKIIGAKIQARAWELLLAMLAMEAVFGLPGVIAAPIYYAYLKRELVDRGLI